MGAGADFVKKIRPIGCIMFVLMFVAVIVICLQPAERTVEGYEPPHDSTYYAAHPDELAEELEENLLPALDGVVSCRSDGEKVAVVTDRKSFASVRAAVLTYYDVSLFTFSAS